ncbi:ABC transporter permease [Henriciella aquimarina]|uniref:ABC transporter permease n=1 Tax=Henriciella aquimarina TaxID=545261 RepID=UPI000A016452|nr:ABC transporter permease [Henriciella aquimarina]
MATDLSADKEERGREDAAKARSGRSIVYSPGYRARSGPIEAISAYAREIRRDRWQVWMNFLRKFKSSYSTTFAGMFWAFALPLVPIGAYTLLATMRVVSTTDDMSHLVYIALGVTLYAYVTAPIEQTMAALKSDKALLSSTHIGVFSVILGRFGTVVFETLVRLGLIAILMVFFGGYPTHWWSAAFLPLLGVVFLSSLGVGLLLAIFNAVAADVEKVVSVILRFGVFFSAVFFPMPQGGLSGQLTDFNPIHTYVNGLRTLLVKGYLPDPAVMAWTGGLGMVIFLVAITLFYRAEPHLRASG